MTQIGVNVKIQSVDDAISSTGINICVHGQAGAGKTVLCTTIPENETAILVNAESGLLSLANAPQSWKDRTSIVTVRDLNDIGEVFIWLEAEKRADWLMMDSSSEVAEVILANNKANMADKRGAYGDMADDMLGLIRYARDLSAYNTLITAKQGRFTDSHTGITVYGPMMPGQQVGQQIPYMFDELFALRVEVDQTEGPNKGKVIRVLQTGPDLSYLAKDRSGTLDMFEPANLAHIVAKIRGGRHHGATAASV